MELYIQESTLRSTYFHQLIPFLQLKWHHMVISFLLELRKYLLELKQYPIDWKWISWDSPDQNFSYYFHGNL